MRRFKLNPFTHFVRARLHRRLFVYFGVTILFTLLAALSVMRLTGSEGSRARDRARERAFLGSRFERVWDDPAARSELGRSMQRDLELQVVIEDKDGRELERYGASCVGSAWVIPVARAAPPGGPPEGQVLGYVAVCSDRDIAATREILIALLVTGFMLWFVSGMLAFKIAWPLGELARVAKDIGDGRYSSRACLGPHHHGEVGLVGRAINEMAARIERQMSEQRELLAAVSHELRTPLARIRLLTEMSRGKGCDDKVFDDLDREVVEIDALVGDLLASSRIDFQVLSDHELDGVELATRALERAGADPTALVVETKDTKMRADATLLGRALANLIDNANKHGGGVAALRIHRNKDQLAFDVEDKGEGFTDGEEVRIFEPFYRRGDQGSLGLGLALVKRIAEAHGGRAYAANLDEAKGARVGFEIPLAAA